MKKSLFTAFALAAVVTGCQTSARMESDMASNSTDRDIRVEAAGSEVDVQASTKAPSGPRVGTQFENLPSAVQDTIREQAKGAEIADIDKEERTGKMVYEVSFRDEGLNPKIHVSEDGRLLNEAQTDLVVRDGANAQIQADAGIQNESAGADLKAESNFADNNDAELQANADLSAGRAEAELQTDISKEAAGAELNKANDADVSIEAAGADSRDKIEAKPEVRGGAEALKEGPSANLDADVEADVNTSTDADGNASFEANVNNEAAGAESKTSLHGSTHGKAVEMNALPQPVQNAIKSRGGQSQVTEIEQKTVYEVKFSNQQQPLMIREDGSVIENE